MAAQLRGLEGEIEGARAASREAAAAAARRETLLTKLGALSERSERIPTHLADSLKAVSELTTLARGKSQEALVAVAVLSLLRALTESIGGVVHHWGDVDPGGIRIGRHVEASLGVVVVPHLMQIQLVTRLGRPAEAGQFAPNIPAESAFFELGEYLRSPNARWLEQEVVDPHPVS